MSGALEARSLSVTLAGRRLPVLDALDLDLAPGSATALTGRSGTGKSTLLKALNGLIPWHEAGHVEGEILLDREILNDMDPSQRVHLLASCLDRPESQLFLATPRHELAAQQRLHGASPLAEELWNALEVEAFMDRRILELSSGERQRVALAVTLSAAPRPLLLDEPTAHLDVGAVQALARALNLAQDAGSSVLAAEHAPWRLGSSVNRALELTNGQLHGAELPTPPALPAVPTRAGHGLVLEARGVVARAGERALFPPIELELREGEVVILGGGNGVGKSTLARILAGVRRPAAGRVRWPGAQSPVLMLPEARLQLFAPTVWREVETGPRSAAEVARVLRRHRLEAHAARAPWTLSRGERQRLVHAALDLLQPPVMIIDEPAQGLDRADLEELVELIHRRAARGRAYLIISHRAELHCAAHRVLELSPAGLTETTPR